jgi:hypothetical protein
MSASNWYVRWHAHPQHGLVHWCVFLTAAVTAAVMVIAVGSVGQTVTSAQSVSATLATQNFTTAGWSTFGQVVPQGLATTGLQLGTLPTQTDIKTTWPDGSIRFAVVTAQIPSTGNYALTQGAQTTAGFTPQVPPALVRFTLSDGTVYTAALPAAPSSDTWLSGPLVREWRTVITPINVATGEAHPFLRVLFDTRSYNDGKSRVDVTVENTLDQVGATKVDYSVDILSGTQTLYHHDTLTHWYLTRWRKAFDLNGLTEAQVTPDLEPVFQASALPRFLSWVQNVISQPTGSTFDIEQRGGLTYDDMSATGGRAEIAPYPDWTALYLIFKDPIQRQFVNANGDLSGSQPIHIRNPDGSLLSLDARPKYWMDARWYPWNDGPASTAWLSDSAVVTGPLRPDLAHQPSLAYVPYLLTGDRYYADEMSFWASFNLIGTYPGSGTYPNDQRQGFNLFPTNQVRGAAWGLRNLVDAAAYLPDSDPMHAYFTRKVQQNLAYADTYADTTHTPLGTYFDSLYTGPAPEDWGSTGLFIDRPWMNLYVAWSLDHARKQSFTGGLHLRDSLVHFAIRLFQSSSDPTSPDYYPQTYGGPYKLKIGDVVNTGPVYYQTLREMFTATYGNPPSAPNPLVGYYGPEERLVAMIGIENGMPGSQQVYDYIMSIVNSQNTASPQESNDSTMIRNLEGRAGWALAIEHVQSTASSSISSSSSAISSSSSSSLPSFSSSSSVSLSSSSSPSSQDTTPPTVTITNPAAGSKLPSKGSVSVSTTASDASGIKSLTLSIDGQLKATCAGVVICTYNWVMNKVPTGSHTIKATAIDASAAAYAASSSITVTK